MKSLFVLCLIFLAFLILRLPVLYNQPGGQDEDCYAVPGLTILESGIPRLPHVPARNTESVYYEADKALYSEPPLYFYVQALFYACLPDVYGTGRLASVFCGLLAGLLVYFLSLQTTRSESASLWAAGLFIFSRWFYFPATSARPDILCTTFGLASVVMMLRWRTTNEWRWMIVAGATIGLGGLTHPFALVYAVQLAVWSMIAGRGWKRLVNPVVLGLAALLIAAAWIPLIALYPSAFTEQFKNQFLSDQGGSLIYRLVMPWQSLWYHSLGSSGMVWHLNYFQTALVLLPAVACVVEHYRGRHPMQPLCWLGLSSIYAISVIVGPHHPVIGYWSYTAGLLFIGTGYYLDLGLKTLWNQPAIESRVRKALAIGGGMLLCGALIPGSGLTTLLVTLKHWDDINYRAPDFAQALMESLPADATYAVDTQFALDFIAHHRKTLLAQTYPMYFCLDRFQFDYLIVSRYGLDTKIAERLPVRRIGEMGIKDDLFACYCEIYVSTQDDQR